MQGELFFKVHRRHVRELNIVPILDMMTTVIFFLLLSTSFLEFTKITVPPSSVSTITDPILPPPLAPKVHLMAQRNSGIRMQLNWGGAAPGSMSKVFSMPADAKAKTPAEFADVQSPEVRKLLDELVRDFHKKFPIERNFQLGMSGPIAYQNLIAAMDGIQSGIQEDPTQVTKDLVNIILVSYRDVDAETAGTGEGP